MDARTFNSPNAIEEGKGKKEDAKPVKLRTRRESRDKHEFGMRVMKREGSILSTMFHLNVQVLETTIIRPIFI